MKKSLLLLLAVLIAFTASAQDFMGQKKEKSPVRWGLIAGMNAADFKLVDTKIGFDNKLGWQAGLMASIGIGRIMSIDPQILYISQNMTFTMPDKSKGEIKCSSIDIPIALGFKIVGPLRLFAGPVFTVLNESSGTYSKQELEFSGIRTTFSYVLGAEVRLFDHLRIDVRYNGQFKNKENVALPADAGKGEMRSQSASLNIGYYF